MAPAASTSTISAQPDTRGGKLVDAKGVSRLYRPRVSGWALMVLVLAAGATILVAMAVSPAGQVLLTYLSAQWDAAKYWLTGLF